METLLYLAIPIAIAVGIYLGIKARKRAKENAGIGGSTATVPASMLAMAAEATRAPANSCRAARIYISAAAR